MQGNLHKSFGSPSGGLFVSPLGQSVMTNDILEQITEDYLRELGYFTQHNIPYRPTEDYKGGTHSDIDVIAVHPLKKLNDPERVIVVSCKSWQEGVDLKTIINRLENDPAKRMREGLVMDVFREIANKKWSDALINEVYKRTNQKSFIFYITAIFFKGDKKAFQDYGGFKNNLTDCTMRLVDLEEMFSFLWSNLTKTPTHSESSRLLQVMKAAKLEVSKIIKS